MPKSNLLKPPSHVVKYLKKLELVPVDKLMKMPAEERLDHAMTGDRLELAGVLYKGFALIGLKDELGHGIYMAGLAERGIGRDTAQRAINLAKLSARVSEENFATLRNLQPSKLLLLLAWSDDELDDFFKGEETHGITVEDAQLNSVRELSDQIKSHRDENDELRQQLATTQIKLNTTQIILDDLRAKRNEEPQIDYHPLIQKVRIEGAALTDHAFLDIDSIAALIDELERNANEISKDHPSQVEAALSTLWINLHAINAKAAQALNTFVKTFGALTLENSEIALMTDIEAKRLLEKRTYMTSQHHAEKALRDEHRERIEKEKNAGKKRGPKPKDKSGKK